MSCYHPLKALDFGVNPETGKHNIKVVGKDYNLEESIVESVDVIPIPCGKCIGCLLDRSRQWADRCMLEAKYLKEEYGLPSCFITLTIDDEHLYTKVPIHHGELTWYPIENKNYDTNGVEKEREYVSLRKKDFQKFMKRLRKELGKDDIKVRYFGCSEYGSSSARPHYHAIIFGYDFSADRVLYKTNFNGDRLYNSCLLSKCWPFGFSVVADCTWNTCAYVSRYCLKKRDNDLHEFYHYCECEPESVFMSRRPGIGRNYYDAHCRDIYRFEVILLGDAKGSRKIRPPHYFDKLYDLDYPTDYKRIKDKRRLSSKSLIMQQLQRTDLDYLEYMNVKEYNHIKRTEILKERSVEK